MSSSWLLLICGAIVASCTMSNPSPRTQAAAIEADCRNDPGAVDLRVVGPKNIDRVEPLYAIVDSKPNGPESRLIGARVHLRSIDGLTAESVNRALTCYAAQRTLKGVGDTCPYSAPEAWVDIAVKSDARGYEVMLQGQDSAEGHQILDRAIAYAGAGDSPSH
jgi:hypothetical protein